METIIKLTSTSHGILALGRQLENNVRSILFDCSALVEEFGDGEATLAHQRFDDVAPYPVTIAGDGDVYTWNITDADTAYCGMGRAEVRWITSDGLGKSVTFMTQVLPSLTGDSVIPEPLQSWYDNLIQYINDHSITEDQLEQAVADYIEAHPISAPVQSVNGETGEVVITASDLGAYVLASTGIPASDLASAVQASLAKADTALQSAPVTSVNGQTGDVVVTAPVTSVNGQTGDVTISIPVTSVNGQTGAVTLVIPSKLSDLTNDEGFYVKPASGIPKTDLASAVQTSLGKADTALQTAPVSSVNGQTGAVTINVPTKTSDLTNDSGYIITESDPTVPSWAKASTKPSYTAAEVGALPDDTTYVSSVNGNSGAVTGLQEQTTVVNKTASDTSQTLAANTFYIWPEMSALTITCPATGGPYAFRFTSGSTATTLTMTGITMPDDFSVEANKVYEVNVYQGYGLAVSWS